MRPIPSLSKPWSQMLALALLATSTRLPAPALFCGYEVADPRPFEGETIPGVDTLIATPRLFIGAKERDSGRINPQAPGWLTLYDRENHQMLGSVGIIPGQDGKNVRLPIYLDRVFDTGGHPDHVMYRRIGRRQRTQQGIGTEAKYAAIAYAFKVLGMRESYARILVGNDSSLQLHRKLGYELVAERFVPEDCRILFPDGPLVYMRLTRAAFDALESERVARPDDYAEFFDPTRRLESRTLYKVTREALTGWRDGVVAALGKSVGEVTTLRPVIDRITEASFVHTTLVAFRTGTIEPGMVRLHAEHRVGEEGGAGPPEYHRAVKALVAPYADAQLLAMLSVDPLARDIASGSADSVYRWIGDLEKPPVAGLGRPVGFPQMQTRLTQFRKELDRICQRTTVVVRVPGRAVWDESAAGP